MTRVEDEDQDQKWVYNEFPVDELAAIEAAVQSLLQSG
jgi:hypothetical protein